MAEQRLVLADSDASFRKNLKAILTKLGYWVVGEAGDGMSAVKMIRSRQPDLVILDADLPGMDGFSLARIVHEDKIAPVVVFVSTHSHSVIEQAKESRVAALLLKPLDESALLVALELAMANYLEVARLENKIKELKEELETRKVVERAKGILMETQGISEAEAFRRIQKQSMNRRMSMRQVAEAVILSHSLGK